MKLALVLKSKSGIHRLVSVLEERGFIKRLHNKARAIKIINEMRKKIYIVKKVIIKNLRNLIQLKTSRFMVKLLPVLQLKL